MSRFSGKTVVITGASRGIGAALARRFAREGASVVVSANEAAAETDASEIAAAGGKAIAQFADVTKKSDVVALYDAAERAFGGVDVSVQNAGVITIARIEAMTEAEWDKVLDVNTKGVFLCCQEAIARMRKHKRAGASSTPPRVRRARASSIRPTTPPRSSALWESPKASPRKELPSTPFVQASSTPTCGPTTTRRGASYWEHISPEN